MASRKDREMKTTIQVIATGSTETLVRVKVRESEYLVNLRGIVDSCADMAEEALSKLGYVRTSDFKVVKPVLSMDNITMTCTVREEVIVS